MPEVVSLPRSSREDIGCVMELLGLKTASKNTKAPLSYPVESVCFLNSLQKLESVAYGLQLNSLCVSAFLKLNSR